MKIAILGNMNNNGFSLLRYLLDLNQDADLLLFKDDEIGERKSGYLQWGVDKTGDDN